MRQRSDQEAEDGSNGQPYQQEGTDENDAPSLVAGDLAVHVTDPWLDWRAVSCSEQGSRGRKKADSTPPIRRSLH
jgi:hypothetical protein